MCCQALLPFGVYLSLCSQVSIPADLLQLDQTKWVPTWCKVSVAAGAAAAAGGAEGGKEGGREIDAALLWCDLEQSPNLRYDLNLRDFRPTYGFNHPPCVLRPFPTPPTSTSGQFSCGVLLRWTLGGRQRRTMGPKSVPVN